MMCVLRSLMVSIHVPLAEHDQDADAAGRPP